MRQPVRSHLDRRGLVWGGVGVAILLAITLLGSDGLVWFDAALAGYLFGLIFATFAIIYRYSVWLRRPPTAMLNQRGWDAFRAGRMHNVAALPALGHVSRQRRPINANSHRQPVQRSGRRRRPHDR